MPPVSTLLDESESADLLVIGSQGPSGLGGFVSGSVAMATVARLEHPVVLVRAGETAETEHLPAAEGKSSIGTPCRDVAVAVDVDEPSDEVLDFAFHAAELRRAQLRAVHAWRVPVLPRLCRRRGACPAQGGGGERAGGAARTVAREVPHRRREGTCTARSRWCRTTECCSTSSSSTVETGDARCHRGRVSALSVPSFAQTTVHRWVRVVQPEPRAIPPL